MTLSFSAEPMGTKGSDQCDSGTGEDQVNNSTSNTYRRVLRNRKISSTASDNLEGPRNSINSDEHVKQVRSDAATKAQAVKELGKLVDLNQLNLCIQNDLSSQCIESVFPKASLKKIIENFKLAFDTDQVPLTAGEKNILKEAFKKGLSVDTVALSLPLRSREYVEKKFNEVVFVGTRRTKFKSSFEKLLYEAQWTLMESPSGSRTTRTIKPPNDGIDKLEKTQKQPKRLVAKKTGSSKKDQRTIGQENDKGKASRKPLTAITQKSQQKIKSPNKVNISRENNTNKTTTKISRKTTVDELNITNNFFQTVTGNGEPIENGLKRRRNQVEYFNPSLEEIEELPNLKNRKISDKIKNIKTESREDIESRKYSKKKANQKVTKNTKREYSLKSKAIKEESGVSHDETNPFDPPSILNDSMVPLNNRKFFIPEFYQEKPLVPSLRFVEDNYDDSVTLKDDKRFALNDISAAEIVSNHYKNYRDLPISFPSILIPDSNTESRIINPNNTIKIRFLIYPQYTEEFILAQPKSNELNPIYEIQKLFQIHYTLYFSHSKKIKKIITEEYCKALDDAVENNSFSDFMFTIDKWNQLMLELTPNSVKDCPLDINQKIRIYLFEDFKSPDAEDLKLDIFFYENLREKSSKNRIIEAPSPQYDIVEKKITQDQSTITPPCSSEEDEKVTHYISGKKYKFDEPKNIRIVSDKSHFKKPQLYIKDFFLNLCLVTKISRFCLHQIFLRVYSRIVSTDSKKLREYKAFTAEVYGELLPSFTSEVLTKVNLLPNQSFYDLGSGVGNTTFQAALEFGAASSGGCELMPHASKLSLLQERLLQKHLAIFGIGSLNLNFALNQSFVDNESVKQKVCECDVLIINNYLFDANLNNDVGRLLYDLKPGTKIISLRNFLRPRYKASGLNTVFDRLKVEKHEMSHFFSVSWTGNKVPYYISTVQENICPEYL